MNLPSVRRHTLVTNGPSAAVTRTCQSPPSGAEAGSLGFAFGFAARTVTIVLRSFPYGGGSFSARRASATTSPPRQTITSHSNSSASRIDLRTADSGPPAWRTNVPAAPRLTAPSARATSAGRNVLLPPTLTPRRKTTSDPALDVALTTTY